MCSKKIVGRWCMRSGVIVDGLILCRATLVGLCLLIFHPSLEAARINIWTAAVCEHLSCCVLKDPSCFMGQHGPLTSLQVHDWNTIHLYKVGASCWFEIIWLLAARGSSKWLPLWVGFCDFTRKLLDSDKTESFFCLLFFFLGKVDCLSERFWSACKFTASHSRILLLFCLDHSVVLQTNVYNNFKGELSELEKIKHLNKCILQVSLPLCLTSASEAFAVLKLWIFYIKILA